jgi:hypothetical protein
MERPCYISSHAKNKIKSALQLGDVACKVPINLGHSPNYVITMTYAQIIEYNSAVEGGKKTASIILTMDQLRQAKRYYSTYLLQPFD